MITEMTNNTSRIRRGHACDPIWAYEPRLLESPGAKHLAYSNTTGTIHSTVQIYGAARRRSARGAHASAGTMKEASCFKLQSFPVENRQ